MDYETFMTSVQERTGIDDRETAEQLAEVALSTLGERLYRTELDDVCAQLPNAVERMLRARKTPEINREDTPRYPLREYYNRVANRADLGRAEAERQSQAVIGVLGQAISAGERQDVLDALPSEYRALFGTAPSVEEA